MDRQMIEWLTSELRTTYPELYAAASELVECNRKLMVSHQELGASIRQLESVNEELRTELKRAEAMARRDAELMQLSHEAVFVWRLDGGIEFWNAGAEELYGFDAREACGRVPHELLATVLPCPWAEIEAALRRHEPWEGELVHRTKYERTVVVSTRLKLGHDEEGIERVLQSNIADRKQSEVAELKPAEEMLRHADRDRNQFLGVLSHELRNPLTPIQNSLSVLDRVPPASEQALRARMVIQRQVRQLTRLVDDLLDVTRVTRGKIRLRRGRFELNRLIRRTIEDHRSMLEAAGLEIETHIDGSALTVDGDSTRIGQAVGNLLQNSVKFTPQGGRVVVELRQDASGRNAEIRVADNGAGISREVLPRLFQPFEQADHTLDRSRGGLGLGLALVKGLVELHGGQVEARSEGMGQGAEFVISLPLQSNPGVAVAIPTPAPARACRRVLVIEDNIDAADSFREALELDGHEVRVAYNGPEGLVAAREFTPDVVLCDLGLPGTDGYQVARTFRADPALSSVHLIALTGYAMPEDVARAREAGFDQHLAKPASLEDLCTVLAGVPRAGTNPQRVALR
jgi:signal transduction histidine kinase/ActR/RegA family two-component response regulator